MRLPLRDRLLIACLSLSSACAMAAPPPNEDNCRTAIQQGLDMLRSPTPEKRPRDEADRQRLLAEMERLVESSRRQGMTECRIWTQMMGKAFNQ
ncbi:MAG: hypothetical protein WC540_12200 [Sulfuritalea sp.]